MADSDVIVVGAGLAGLAATAELAEAGRKVLLLDQEPELSLGGQAHWSFGGLFLVGSPEQRRMGIKDSRELDRRPGRRGLLGLPLGPGLRGLRRDGEKTLAARNGGALVSRGRLGRARRLPRRRARQLGPALPRHLGHRTRSGRTVRAAGPGGRGVRLGGTAVPAPGR